MIQSEHTTQQPSFAQRPLRQELIKSLASSNYENMTSIQMQSPLIILKNEDIIAQAKTGSGKTIAFALSLLSNLKISFFAVQGVPIFTKWKIKKMQS